MALKKGEEVTLEIESAAFRGKGVAKVDGLAVFVYGTAPGDLVKARIIKKKKNYREAKLLEVLEPSKDRITPKCQHANVCGGCSWQHVPYAKQLEYKGQQVADHITRLGGLSDTIVHPAMGSESDFYYRNKMEYSFSNRRWLTQEEINKEEFVDDSGFAAGMHAPGRFDKILNLNECHLQRKESFEILDFVRNYCIQHDIPPFDAMKHEGFMRHLMIRNSFHTDDFMVNFVTYQDDQKLIKKLSDELLQEFPVITTIVNNINDTKSPTSIGRIEKIIHGPGYIVDKIGDHTFKIHPNAFFQTNTAQAERLYETAREFADLKDGEVVYDLYCGVGTLSLFMSQKAEKVLGIELVDVAVENARYNAKENNVGNVSFIKGDMKDVFTQEMVDEFGAPDVLITDPPRAGMHPDVVKRLKELRVPKLVYVSCDSSTMARDLKELAEVYDVLEVQPVDMFPQTYHVEAVAKLRLKQI
ncbi:MAG: 23S rRNA (uracil(1939)-C(5))-methyltransferase RlmD [Balneola sp.]|nr:23S rRNA (uracil(1939)-C(5))-methyltransferase RlmD [Balneola sp.]MBO6652175.1 23S rRNA (uracil(1939)-C(5))-methyltransferase RlmD [Balneola sp.]MBO6710698.1 23S rRNA (uracil(1939)-C(5))-methyltransferase RlmD [Balneola sp.]MBO6799384.1 23S rRNA (uracil(1939)-C(5))-methyltransferase RlmD [Balneola sp.]MBO6869487.1 23S rRNA (uracil(1939)-C(5))-methyltransferase RlmD [Balneola sp.]